MGRKKLSALILSVLFFFTSICSIDADNNQKLKDVQNKINEIHGQIGKKNEKLSQVNQDIMQIDGKISEIETKIFETDKNLREVQEKIRQNKIKISSKQKEIEDLKKLLSKRIRIMSRINNLDYMEVLLSSKDIKDFLSRYTTIKKIIKQDNENVEKLKLAKKDLEEIENSLEKDEKNKKNLLDILNSENQKLNENKKRQKEIVQQLNSDINSLTQLENLKIEESNQIMQEIRRAQEERKKQEKNSNNQNTVKTPAVYSGGKMAFPLPGGIITSPYGSRFHPILHRQMFHSGIDIGAGYGSPIHAAKSGNVIYAGYKGTYGQAVIIDHLDSTATLYAHCSAVNVSAGQYVNTGDVVAFVGNSGRSTGPHLHFEVRINGQYTDPMPYLR